jgi:rRNA large subunit m3Psi methyltransferase RlmH
MRATLVAVGTRQPAWVDAGFRDYARRLQTTLPLELIELETAPRSKSGDAARARAGEARAILAAVAGRGHLVALDERGRLRSTRELAQWLEKRRQMGENLWAGRLRARGAAEERRAMVAVAADVAARPGARAAGRTAVPRQFAAGRTSLPSGLSPWMLQLDA